jgi:hypothetical protein
MESVFERIAEVSLPGELLGKNENGEVECLKNRPRAGASGIARSTEPSAEPPHR